MTIAAVAVLALCRALHTREEVCQAPSPVTGKHSKNSPPSIAHAEFAFAIFLKDQQLAGYFSS